MSNHAAKLAMWKSWQNKVIDALPNFCADKIYVEQNSVPQEEFNQVLTSIPEDKWNALGMARDIEYGARAFEIPRSSFRCTRMWLDAQVEIDFLMRHLRGDQDRRHAKAGMMAVDSEPRFPQDWHILDIGAGYGRLAVEMAPFVKRYYCVDAVPISTKLCTQYVEAHGLDNIIIFTMDDLEKRVNATLKYEQPAFDLAINIHSWNECNEIAIVSWLEKLKTLRVPYLFTVSHGQLKSVPSEKWVQRAYYMWNNGGASYRPLLEAQYDLIAEESIGLGSHPHALWKLK